MGKDINIANIFQRECGRLSHLKTPQIISLYCKGYKYKKWIVLDEENSG